LEEDGESFAEKTFALTQDAETARIKLKSIVEDSKRLLIENFPSSEARTCLIQLSDYLAERKA
jgi:hypothetical protein